MARKVVFSNDQLDKVRQMIDEGFRQSDIAKYFKVTDDTLRKICRENNILIHMPHKCVCVLCGETFFSNIKNAKVCNKEHHRKCKVCGNDFIVKRDDIRETCSLKCLSLDKYGVDHPGRAKEVVEARQSTVKARYGVDNISQISDHNEKTQATCLNKYGATSYAGSEIGRKATQQTNLERYGVRELLSDSKLRNRIAATNISKYGTEFPMQNAEVRAKVVSTCKQRYGGPSPMSSPEVVDKIRTKFKEIYGKDWATKCNSIKDKTSETCMSRFGVPWACMRKEARNYKTRSNLNKEFERRLIDNGFDVESEFPLSSYSFDFKVGDNLIELDPTITHNSEISIFKGGSPTPSSYHIDKTQAALDNGYRCIHVFDWDDWNHVTKLIIPKEVIYARKCKVRSVSVSEAGLFISANHIQGMCKGSEVSLGLYFEDELVQIITLGRPRYNRKFDFELLRLCSKSGVQVVGGPSKLFSHFIKEHPNASVISYCDASKFTGSVYAKMGMKLSYWSSPAKVWSRGKERITDNLLRQRGYDQLFGTSYGKGTSNEQLMLDNGWLPVYDCGQKVFVFDPNENR